MSKAHLLFHSLVPTLLLFAFSAAASAQSLPDGDNRPHPPDNIPRPRSEVGGISPGAEDISRPPQPDGQRKGLDRQRKELVRAALRRGDRAYSTGPLMYMIAADSYREAGRLNPKEERAYIGMGNVYVALKRYDIAVRMYTQAADIKPKSAEAHYGLGAAYHAQGRKYAALEEYKILQRLDKKMAAKLSQLLSQEKTQ